MSRGPRAGPAQGLPRPTKPSTESRQTPHLGHGQIPRSSPKSSPRSRLPCPESSSAHASAWTRWAPRWSPHGPHSGAERCAPSCPIAARCSGCSTRAGSGSSARAVHRRHVGHACTPSRTDRKRHGFQALADTCPLTLRLRLPQEHVNDGAVGATRRCLGGIERLACAQAGIGHRESATRPDAAGPEPGIGKRAMLRRAHQRAAGRRANERAGITLSVFPVCKASRCFNTAQVQEFQVAFGLSHRRAAARRC
jgi:hypothetical protein